MIESPKNSHIYPDYSSLNKPQINKLGLLQPLGNFVDNVQIKNSHLAHIICRIIPCCCPFERDIYLLGLTVHIPALCKLNPLYNEFVSLRFRALSYLADVCGEDISKYICGDEESR